MARRDVVVVGASAGGVEALKELAAGLPPGFPAAVFVVLHIYPYSQSYLPQILHRMGPLPALHPYDGQQFEPGRIYVAPPDFHMLVKRGRVTLGHGPRENRSRPAVDVLFRSAAEAYGQRVIGVVLTGMLDDGTAGLLEVKRRGGLAIAQDPAEAVYPDMPRSAIENVECDYVATLGALPGLLTELVQESVPDARPTSGEGKEVDIAELDVEGMRPTELPGKPSEYACPDCSGVMWEIQDGPIIRYRCRVGHAYSALSLLASQAEVVEDALWMALRSVEESVSYATQLAKRYRQLGHAESAAHLDERAARAESYTQALRDTIADVQTTYSEDWRGAQPSASGDHQQRPSGRG